MCHKECDRDNFSTSQWQKGAAAACRNCVESKTSLQRTTAKVCCKCGKHLARASFSKHQWEAKKGTGNCRACAAAKQQAWRETFNEKQRSKSSVASYWPDATTPGEAARFFFEAGPYELPSESGRAFQAAHAKLGTCALASDVLLKRHILRCRGNWATRAFQADHSDYTPEKKVDLLAQAHESLGHLGGREGIVAVLKDNGVQWRNIRLDAVFVLQRCQDLSPVLTLGKAFTQRFEGSHASTVCCTGVPRGELKRHYPACAPSPTTPWAGWRRPGLGPQDHPASGWQEMASPIVRGLHKLQGASVY